MSKALGNKKLTALKGSSNTNNQAKPVKTNKDDIKNYIDSEFSKFQAMKSNNTNERHEENNLSASAQINSMKENMKKIKDLNSQTKINDLGKSEEIFRVSQTKFKIPEMKNLNSGVIARDKTPEESFNNTGTNYNSRLNNTRPKTPFTIKKFENSSEIVKTKEIIEDLKKTEVKFLEFFITLYF